MAIHAPVPVVKTANGQTMNHTARTQQTVRNLMSGGDFFPVVKEYHSPIFLGGSNANKSRKTNMKHCRTKAKRRGKN